MRKRCLRSSKNSRRGVNNIILKSPNIKSSLDNQLSSLDYTWVGRTGTSQHKQNVKLS